MSYLKPENNSVLNEGAVDSLPVIMLGAGGHAKVLIEMLKRNNTEIIGLVDPAHQKGVFVNGVPVIGDDNVVDNYSKDEIQIVNGIGALPGKEKRISIARIFRTKGYQFATVIDTNTCIASDVELSDGVQIMPGVIVQPGVKIGQDSILNTGVNLDHDCQIGSNVHIAPGSTLCGNVRVRDGVHIGAGTTVVQSVEIGEESIIGAGSVIVSDIENHQKFIQRKDNITTDT